MRGSFANFPVSSKPLFWYSALVLALVVFSALSLPRLQQPIGQDEFYWLFAAKTSIETGVPRYFGSQEQVVYAPHPHLYLFSILAAYRFLGEGLTQARILGYLGGLLTIILIFISVRSLGSGTAIDRLRGAGAAALLYAVSPLMVQATILIDDITLLIPITAGLVMCFVKFQQNGSLRWACALAAVFALALWTRITTPPLAAGILVLYGLACGPDRWRKLGSLAAFAIGAIAFLGSWYLYCVTAGIPFSGPFVYLVGSFLAKSPGSSGMSISTIGQAVIHLIFWLGVFSTMLLCVVVFLRLREKNFVNRVNPPDPFLVTGICLTLGFCIVGGAGFGFPKYHCPGLILLLIAAGLAFTKREVLFSMAVLFGAVLILAATAVAQLYIGGDPLYLLRYSLRNQAVMGLSVMPVLLELGLRVMAMVALFACAVLAAIKVAGRKVAFSMFMLLAIGASLGTSLRQNFSGYQTGYNYGGSGTREVAGLIKEQLRPGSSVLVPSEVLYYLNDSLTGPFPHPKNSVWTNLALLKEKLTDTTTATLAYSLPTNTVAQVKMLSTEPSLLAILESGYEKAAVGTYTVWLRRQP